MKQTTRINVENTSELIPKLLTDMIGEDDRLYRLANRIDWKFLEQSLAPHFNPDIDPSPRLIVGLLYLQAVENLSYDEVRVRWTLTPAWQYFCGETLYCFEYPLNPAALSIWSRVVGAAGRKLMCQALVRPIREGVH
jgi:IS5 family transposase